MAFGAALFSSAELALQTMRPSPPISHAASARKIRRNILKRLNPRPGSRRLVAALAERGDAVDDRVYKPSAPANAREFSRKTLKTLNPRPSSSPSPRFSGERAGVRGCADIRTPAPTPILTFSP